MGCKFLSLHHQPKLTADFKPALSIFDAVYFHTNIYTYIHTLVNFLVTSQEKAWSCTPHGTVPCMTIVRLGRLSFAHGQPLDKQFPHLRVSCCLHWSAPIQCLSEFQINESAPHSERLLYFLPILFLYSKHWRDIIFQYIPWCTICRSKKSVSGPSKKDQEITKNDIMKQ